MKKNNSNTSMFFVPLIVTGVVIANQLNGFCVGPAFATRQIIKASVYKSRDEHGIFEKYDNSKNAEERRERLDAFAGYLKENQHFQAYIMSYGGRRSYLGEAKTRGKSAKRYLVKSKGINPSRITVIDAGYREDWAIELWYGVTGGSSPAPPNNRSKASDNQIWQIIGGGDTVQLDYVCLALHRE